VDTPNHAKTNERPKVRRPLAVNLDIDSIEVHSRQKRCQQIQIDAQAKKTDVFNPKVRPTGSVIQDVQENRACPALR